jgi:hypothetical protein
MSTCMPIARGSWGRLTFHATSIPSFSPNIELGCRFNVVNHGRRPRHNSKLCLGISTGWPSSRPPRGAGPSMPADPKLLKRWHSLFPSFGFEAFRSYEFTFRDYEVPKSIVSPSQVPTSHILCVLGTRSSLRHRERSCPKECTSSIRCSAILGLRWRFCLYSGIQTLIKIIDGKLFGRSRWSFSLH